MVGKELDPGKIQDKEIRKFVKAKLAKKWILFEEGHKARLRCPCEHRCTTIPIPGTPKNPGNALKRIKQAAAYCPLPKDSPRRNLTGMDRD